jgi:hypothetical protein
MLHSAVILAPGGDASAGLLSQKSFGQELDDQVRLRQSQMALECRCASTPWAGERGIMPYSHEAFVDLARRQVEIFGKIITRIAASGVERKLVDLGAGSLIFSRIAGEQDCSVTAVDVRIERLPIDRGKVEFIQFDIRDSNLETSKSYCYVE